MNYSIGTIVFGNWVVKRKIGEGSFGQVFEIQREDFGQVYRAALKVITVPQNDAELRSAIEEGMSSAQAEQYFYSVVEDIVREFAIMAKLKGTTNVVSYEDHTVIRHSDGLGWDILIRMELLNPLLPYAYDHPFSRRDIIKLGIDMCRALELCQKYNIIHRDIKPENIFVSDNGDFKLGDFGIARTVEKTMSGLSKKGTYNYMAPEVYRGTEYGFSVDIYSLGIVLYRLLNKNRLPFLPPAPDPITHHSREVALAKRIGGEELPPPFHAEGRLAEIVLNACSYSPKERYSSPAQMRQELEAILYDLTDAELIYPDGDELALVENKYISQTPTDSKNSFDASESSKTESVFGKTSSEETRWKNKDSTIGVFGASDFGDKTSATESVFHKTVSESGSQKVAVSKPKSSIGKIILPVVLLAAVAGGALFYLNNQKEAEVHRQEQYLQLMNEGDLLCDTDPIAASEKYLAAQELNPDDPAPYSSYAYALYCASEYESCITYIEDTLALGKSYSVEVQSALSEILGAAYFETGDYAAAASFFRLSTAGGALTVPAMRDYAVSLGRLGDISAASEILQRMIDEGADDMITTYVQGEVHFAQEEYVEAETEFMSVLNKSTDVALQKRSLRSLAEVYRDCSALVRTNQSPISTPATKEAELLAWGIAEFGLRYDSTIWEMLALAYFEAYHTDTAVSEDFLVKSAECFNRVLELGVTKEYLYSNLYTIYYELGDFAAAEQVLTDYESQYKISYMPHALRAMMLITIENQEEQDVRDYSGAVAEYYEAKSLIRGDDDATYFQQLESLILELEREGWI